MIYSDRFVRDTQRGCTMKCTRLSLYWIGCFVLNMFVQKRNMKLFNPTTYDTLNKKTIITYCYIIGKRIIVLDNKHIQIRDEFNLKLS